VAKKSKNARDELESRLDQELADTFPASDPLKITRKSARTPANPERPPSRKPVPRPGTNKIA
jgi:hypothetical protein